MPCPYKSPWPPTSRLHGNQTLPYRWPRFSIDAPTFDLQATMDPSESPILNSGAIQSDRLRSREFRADDWAAMHAWASRPEVCRYQGWEPNTPEETRAFLQTVLDAAATHLRLDFTFAVTLPGEDTPIGSGSLYLRNPRFRSGEIAYVLHPDHWGQGLGTEIACLLLTLGFGRLGLHRISASCDPRNIASGRALQKAGMTREGRLRQNLLIRDGWRDSDIYGILADEWAERAGR